MEALHFSLKVAFMAILMHEVVLEIKWLRATHHSLPKTTLDWLRNDINVIPFGTVNWCKGNESSGRVCNYRNMCYSHYHNTFLLVNGNNSIFNQDVPQQYILRKHVVNLATPSTTHFPFDYVEVSLQHAISENFLFRNYQKGKYFMYYSFVAGNIIHAIHDELLPLFNTMQTYEKIRDKPIRTLLLLRDPFGYDDIINLFSKYPFISQSDLSFEPKESLTCFEDMTIGFSRETLWYQFGMEGEPEGPIADSKINLEHITNFTNFVKKGFGISPFCENAHYAVYFSRKKTRLVLNENYLIQTLSNALDIEVRELSMEHNSIQDIIETTSCAKIAIGVHGAILVFSMFLPPHSLLLELYPFALNPSAYTPYKTLTSIPGMDIEYRAWRNTNSSNTVTHPTNMPKMGGIYHLSKEEQERIINSEEVPPHLCCYDPEFRFRLNQDTVVDVHAIIDILRSSSVLKMLQD